MSEIVETVYRFLEMMSFTTLPADVSSLFGGLISVEKTSFISFNVSFYFVVLNHVVL